MLSDHDRAWNNFVSNSDPSSPEITAVQRYAAIANQFMGGVNNGGFNAFLTATPELGGKEVADALSAVGARSAAEQLSAVLVGLGEPLVPSSAETRWVLLDQLWTEEMDALDVLSERGDAELLEALKRHVRDDLTYYLDLDESNPNGS
jgi:hypothetical protein